MPNQYFYGFQWSLEFQEISILYWNYKGICDLGDTGIPQNDVIVKGHPGDAQIANPFIIPIQNEDFLKPQRPLEITEMLIWYWFLLMF